MAVEISNLSAAICAVDVTPVFVGGIPRYKGNRANAGFAPFAPTPAPPNLSERLGPGFYRLHVTQSFGFPGGDATVLASLNEIFGFPAVGPSGIAAAAPFPPGPTGTDVFVVMVGHTGEGPLLLDENFSVFLLNLPVQLTAT